MPLKSELIPLEEKKTGSEDDSPEVLSEKILPLPTAEDGPADEKGAIACKNNTQSDQVPEAEEEHFTLLSNTSVGGHERDLSGRNYVESEETSFTNAPFFHPSRLPYKLVVLIFICMLPVGAYYCYDIPTALQKQLLTEMNISLQEYTLLYSVYSWPCVIVSLLGGFLVDSVFGIRLGSTIFSLILAVGQFVFAFGAFINQYWLMVVGRFLFALGTDGLSICQNLYAAVWYKSSMLNMVFGLELSVGRLASSASFWTMQPIYNTVQPYGSKQPGYLGLGMTISVGVVVCLASLACTIILSFLDRHSKKVLKECHSKEHKSKTTWNALKAIVEIRHFPLQMWLLCAICAFYYVSVFTFVALAQSFYIQKYSLDVNDANTVNSLVFLIPLFASPFLGFLIDRTGKNIFWILLGCLLTTIAHAQLAFSFVNPYFSASLLGLSYSILASSLWPFVAYVMPVENLGTAYGVMQAVQNFGIAVMSLLSGVIVGTKGYLILEIVFLQCLFVAICCTLVLWLLDNGRSGGLNFSTSKRKHLAKRKKL